MDSHCSLSTLKYEIIFLLADCAGNAVCRPGYCCRGVRPHAEVQLSRIQYLKAHQCLTTTRICHAHQDTGACRLPHGHSFEGMPHADVKGVGTLHEALSRRRVRFNFVRHARTPGKGTQRSDPAVPLTIPW